MEGIRDTEWSNYNLLADPIKSESQIVVGMIAIFK
jgi:hypothetical protein